MKSILTMPTSDEIKAAMIAGTPVEYDGITFDRISAYIYRVGQDARTRKYHAFLQCELLSEKTNSVVIVSADKIELKG